MQQPRSKPTTAFIALGSNLGDRREAITRAVEMLDNAPDVSVAATSRMIETSPLAGMDQPLYLNSIAKVETGLSARELFDVMQHIEGQLGRRRGDKWGPRSIDLDLVLFGDEVIQQTDLTVPHTQMHLRSFVLDGMCELATDHVHPVIGRTVHELLERLKGGNYVLSPDRPQLISVAGVIGVGKTTLAEGIARVLGCPLMAEAYDENPYLAEVYSGREDLALKSQLFFLKSRFAQLNRHELSPGEAVVSDYVFDKEMIYASRTLNAEQLAAYRLQHKSLAADVCQPVVAIYLHDTPQACLDRIGLRNRSYEKQIALAEVEQLKADYDSLFSGWQKCPLIRLDASRFDCRDAKQVREFVEELRSYLWK